MPIWAVCDDKTAAEGYCQRVEPGMIKLPAGMLWNCTWKKSQHGLNYPEAVWQLCGCASAVWGW